MDAQAQERLRQYLLKQLVKLTLSPPNAMSAEHLLAHYAELNGRAIGIIEFAIEELAQK
jgi:hypothetical protein